MELVGGQKYHCPLAVVLFSSAIFLACCFTWSTPSHVKAEGAISQGFHVNTADISTGELLSLVAGKQNIVQPANSTNVSNLVGIAASSPLVEIRDNNGDNVKAVISGSSEALVTNINGSIKIGDKITASPINGIGMKATASTQIVGTAQADFRALHLIKQSVTELNGKSSVIEVGLMPIEVNVTFYSVNDTVGSIASILPPFLLKSANAISRKQVSPIRVLLATLVLLMGFSSGAIMLYASVQANIASLGRNPLAEKALRRGFMNVAVAALGVLIITASATYVIIAT